MVRKNNKKGNKTRKKSGFKVPVVTAIGTLPAIINVAITNRGNMADQAANIMTAGMHKGKFDSGAFLVGYGWFIGSQVGARVLKRVFGIRAPANSGISYT